MSVAGALNAIRGTQVDPQISQLPSFLSLKTCGCAAGKEGQLGLFMEVIPPRGVVKRALM